MADVLLVAAVGIGVVFSALVLIQVFIGLLGRAFEVRSVSADVTPVAPAIPSADDAGELDPVRFAVIAAAAAAAVGKPVRVQRITFINRNTVSAWAERGRVSIHASHNVKRSL